MMCDARMWGPQVAALSGQRALHLPPITGADSISDLARKVLDDAPPRFALTGLSMGGIVAMEILAQAPDRVDRLALLDTNPLAEAPEVSARRTGQVDRVLAGGLDGVMRGEMKPLYLADTPRRGAILHLCMAMARALGPQVFARQSRALAARADRTATLRAFRGPALVLMGEQDVPCPRDRHDLMHALMPQSRLVIIPGAGHLPVLEQPDATNAALADWLAA
jgi:pimeloyl-ACP methyl ester carboxylesterase